MMKLLIYLYQNFAYTYIKKGEKHMKVVVKNKKTFDTSEYKNVSNIAYNASTKIYTITYGSSQTASFSSDDWLVAIVFG